MAITLIDGFDLYGSFNDAIATGLWNVVDTVLIDPTGGRFGGAALKATGLSAGAQYCNCSCQFATNKTNFISVSYKISALPTSGSTSLFSVFNDSNSRLFTLSVAANGAIYVIDASGAQDTSSPTGAIIANTYQRIEAKFNPGTSTTTGSLEVKVDGAVIVSLTGKNYYYANGGAFIRFFGVVGLGRPVVWYDDLVVNDTTGGRNDDYLGDVRIDILRPVSDTEQADFATSTGSDGFALIDDPISANDGDATYIESITPGDKSEFNLSNIIGSSDILGVQARICATKTDAGSRTFRAYIKSGEAVANGEAVAPATYYGWSKSGIWDSDPNTEDEWSEAGLNNLQLGIELVS